MWISQVINNFTVSQDRAALNVPGFDSILQLEVPWIDDMSLPGLPTLSKAAWPYPRVHSSVSAPINHFQTTIFELRPLLFVLRLAATSFSSQLFVSFPWLMLSDLSPREGKHVFLPIPVQFLEQRPELLLIPWQPA